MGRPRPSGLGATLGHVIRDVDIYGNMLLEYIVARYSRLGEGEAVPPARDEEGKHAMKSQSRLDPLTLLLSVGKIAYEELSRGVEATLDRKVYRPIDTEAKPESTTEGDFASHVNGLRPKPEADRESNKGLAQTPLDRDVHRALRKRLRHLIKGSLVAGEEANPADWTRATDAARRQTGALVWIVDAVDGSGPQDTCGYGYSTNILLYDTAERSAVPILSVMVKENGLMIGWIEGHTPIAVYLNVRHGSAHGFRVVPLTEPLADPKLVTHERERWVATVAAQPKDRQLITPLLTADSPWTVMTMGGAPAMAGLVVDKLGAVIISKPQSRHDAAPLLAIAKVGGVGHDLFFLGIQSGELFSPEAIASFFRGIVRPPATKSDNPAYTPIPPMIVGRDRNIVESLRAELVEHLQTSDARTGTSGQGHLLLRLVPPPV